MKKQKKKGGVRPFFDFNKRNFNKKAVNYHREIRIITNDLISTNRKISRALALCKRTLQCFGGSADTHRISKDDFKDFEDLQYHLHNFCFRTGAYRDKLCQFINQALKLGYDENEMNLLEKIKKNGIAKKAHIDTELKKFSENIFLKWAHEKRKLLTHRLYYGSKNTGYHPLMMPALEDKKTKEITTKNINELIKKWKEKITKEAGQADGFTSRIMKINDSVMEKINQFNKYK